MLPERRLSTGVAMFGAVGSGKTSARTEGDPLVCRIWIGSLLQTWAITAVRRPFDVSPGVGHGLHLAAREHRRLIGVIR